LAVLLAASVVPAADEDKDVAATVLASKDHTILASAIKETGLVTTLRGSGPITLFAPTDAAFRKLGDDAVRALVADKDRLKALVLAHVVTGKAVNEKDAAGVRDLNGFPVSTRSGFTIGPAKVTKADVKCGNGVIHVIDTVLLPK
jgi:uncharacterized surface protein with fasciclin (FAS1) repeats